MGHNIAINIEMEKTAGIQNLFEPLFSIPFFNPVAIGGMAITSTEINWFLSGFAIEKYISRFSRDFGKPCSIEFGASVGSRERNYLDDLSQHLENQTKPSKHNSPFEVIDDNLGISYLRDVSISNEAVDRFSKWTNENPFFGFRIYGTFDIAVNDIDSRPPASAFRFDITPQDPAGSCFLFISGQILPHDRNMIAMRIFSESTIWLENGSALGGRVGKREADINLRNLTKLATEIYSHYKGYSCDINFEFDGKFFKTEADRIQRFMGDIPFNP